MSRANLFPFAKKQKENEQYILASPRAPGDILLLTTVLSSIKTEYPNLQMDIQSAFDQIKHNNPYITPLRDVPRNHFLEIDHHAYIHTTNLDYVESLHRDAEIKLDKTIPITCRIPQIYLTAEEKQPLKHLPKRYLVGSFSYKKDTTTKFYSHYREMCEKIKTPIVQIGNDCDPFTLVPSTINMVGRTNIRQLFSLVYNSAGCIGGITFLQHIAAALNKPYVCLWGGREPDYWINYPNQLKIYGECPYSPCWSLQCGKQDWFFEQWYGSQAHQPYKPYCQWVASDGYASCLSNLDPHKVAEQTKEFLKIE
jgi:ADP-heptose:LPS heptosyltransferase